VQRETVKNSPRVWAEGRLAGAGLARAGPPDQLDARRPAPATIAEFRAADRKDSDRLLLAGNSIAGFTGGVVESAAALAGKRARRPVLPWSWALRGAVSSEEDAFVTAGSEVMQPR
jgi:hypothetical protein